LGNTSIVPAAPFPLDDQNKNIGLNRSDKYASIHSFSSPFISLDKKEENGSTLLSPASTSSVHDGSVPCTVLGQEKAQAPPTSSDLHVYHLKHDFNAANPAKDTVPNGSSGSDLLSVSPGASHHTDGSGFVLKTGGPVVLNVEGEEENTETGIHHENEFFDAFPPYGDVIGNRIDDTLLVLKSKVSLHCNSFSFKADLIAHNLSMHFIIWNRLSILRMQPFLRLLEPLIRPSFHLT